MALAAVTAAAAAVGCALDLAGLPAALAVVVALTAATAAIGIPLLALTGASVLDGYLATTAAGCSRCWRPR